MTASGSGDDSLGPRAGAGRGPGFRLLAITPPTGAVDPALVSAWEAARTVGLAVLLREPGTTAAAMLDPGHRFAALRRACAQAGVPCLLSIDAHAAAPSEAQLRAELVAGVQLRGDPDSAAVAATRAWLGAARVLGRSCHGTPLPRPDGVDYSVLAPIFPPTTASPLPGPGKVAVGLPPLTALAAREPYVFALGGITPERAAACLQAGAYGLAAIGTFFGGPTRVADNVERLVRALTEPSDDAAPPR